MNSPTPPRKRGVPVLTNRVAGTPAGKRKQPSPPVSPASSPSRDRGKVTGITGMADEEAMWDELEQRLVRQIMKHVTDRLDFILDHSIPARISTILHQTAVILAEDIKQDLDKTLEVLVTHAVLDELLNIRSKKLAQQDETN